MKKTVGQASYELQQKPPEKISVIDMQREMQKSFASELSDTINKNRHLNSLYYIKVMFRKDRLMSNVIRQQFIAPYFAKPLPDYDISLYSFDNRTQELKYYWTIPDPDSCAYMMLNSKDLPEEQKPLLEFVKLFSEGKLV